MTTTGHHPPTYAGNLAITLISNWNPYSQVTPMSVRVGWGVPDYMAAAPVARGELVPLFGAWQIEPMPMYLMFPPGRHVNQRLRVFIDWVTALMKA